MSIFNKFRDKNKNQKSDEELKAEVFKKATEHLNAESELSEQQQEDKVEERTFTVHKDIDQAKKQNIRTVLLEIAERGETGVLPVSISDKAGINQQETATALDYLTSQNYAEAINSPSGMKYYLTEAGRKFCISKEFNSFV